MNREGIGLLRCRRLHTVEQGPEMWMKTHGSTTWGAYTWEPPKRSCFWLWPTRQQPTAATGCPISSSGKDPCCRCRGPRPAEIPFCGPQSFTEDRPIMARQTGAE